MNLIGSSKFKRRRRSKDLVQNVSHVHPHVLELESPEAAQEGSQEDYPQKENGTCSSHRPIAYPTDAVLMNGYNGMYLIRFPDIHLFIFCS